MTKRTFSPSVRKKLKKYGFRSRNKSKTGKKVIKRRILKGRKHLS